MMYSSSEDSKEICTPAPDQVSSCYPWIHMPTTGCRVSSNMSCISHRDLLSCLFYINSILQHGLWFSRALHTKFGSCGGRRSGDSGADHAQPPSYRNGDVARRSISHRRPRHSSTSASTAIRLQHDRTLHGTLFVVSRLIF